MITTPVVGNAGSSRRTLYRHTKRMLLRLLARRWKGPRNALEPVRRFLRAKPRGYLLRLAGDRRGLEAFWVGSFGPLRRFAVGESAGVPD